LNLARRLRHTHAHHHETSHRDSAHGAPAFEPKDRPCTKAAIPQYRSLEHSIKHSNAGKSALDKQI
jgi:hypothetical protein